MPAVGGPGIIALTRIVAGRDPGLTLGGSAGVVVSEISTDSVAVPDAGLTRRQLSRAG